MLTLHKAKEGHGDDPPALSKKQKQLERIHTSYQREEEPNCYKAENILM